MIQGHRSMPILSVEDVEKSVGFFTGGLGFSFAGSWQDDNGVPNFAIVVLDHITVGLQRVKQVKNLDTWAAYFYVEDIDAYAAQVTGSGVSLTSEIADKPHGCRELEITDPDGNVLCFGQDLSPSEDGPGL
ncbi:MAG: VOC family protein [Amylibacter sp.]|nr:VOC family protein [Amylibacter sp.]